MLKQMFQIKSVHTSYEDHYEKGEGAFYHEWSNTATITADSIYEAVEAYCKREIDVCFDVDVKDHVWEYSDDNKLYTSRMIDRWHEEPSAEELEKWKLGQEKLWIEHIVISINELVPVNISAYFKSN